MGFLFPVQKVEKYGDITLIEIHKLAPDALILVIYVDILFIKGIRNLPDMGVCFLLAKIFLNKSAGMKI